MQKGIYYSFLPGETVEEHFTQAKALGFDCVEIPTLRTPEDRERYLKAAQAAGIRIPSVMNNDHWAVPFSDPDPAVRAKGMLCLQQSLDTAVAVGADTVLVVPAVVTPSVRFEDAWLRSQLELRSILPAFAEKHVYMAIEDVGNKILLSAPEMKRYIEELGSPWAVAYFDVGNIVNYGFPQHWILSLGSLIKKVHVKGYDAKTRMATPDLLSGTIDWPAVMAAFRMIGYDDIITAELKGVGDTAVERCRNISQDMDSLLKL